MRSVQTGLARLWASGRNGKIAIVVGGFLVACCALGAIGQLVNPRQAGTPTSAPAAAAPTTAAAPAATAAPAPTTVPPTEAPTATPEPTATPQPPTPTPEPIRLSGKGENVTDKFMLPGGGVAKLAFTHTGRRNFIVTLYTASGQSDILVNAIGAYQGTRLAAAADAVYLEIKADGAWTVEAQALGRNDAQGAAFSGKGDQVSDLFEPPALGPVPVAVSHDGKRNFIVQLHCAGGDRLVENTIGATSGAVVARFTQGPCAWEVQADGTWSIEKRE